MVGSVESVNELVGVRRFAEAARLLTAAAGKGEAAALFELAQWRVAGTIVSRDLREARDLLGRAAHAGKREARLLHASFLANGTGGTANWAAALSELRALAPHEPQAAAQLRLLDQMDLDGDGFPAHPIESRQLSTAPIVACSGKFFTVAECVYLKDAGGPALQPSVIADPTSGQMMPHPVRTSDAAYFGVYAEDLVVNALNRRIAAFSRTALVQGEPLQVLRYRPGGEYRAHKDALSNEPNQRILTVLIYLSDRYAGGETHFPRTGLSFRGSTGDALIFNNVTSDGRPDPLATHAGLPVTSGVKWIASRWIRARAFEFPPPRPILGDLA